MNALQTFLINFIKNPKSTLVGLAGGSASAGAILLVFQQAGCNWEAVHWGAVATAFLAPTAIGGVAKDARTKGQFTRASDRTDTPMPPAASP